MRIANEITREAKRLIVRHETRGRLLAEENARRIQRSTAPVPRSRLQRPAYWSLDDGFDPYLARARAERIGHSIRQRLRDLEYRPRHPVRYTIPKAGGGHREVCIYQVADGAVSKMLFEGILKKNLPLLSARAYAYRKDVSAQDAIQYVKSEFRGRSRLFIAEYDFRSYFDTIDHEHIRRTLRDHFLLTEVERSAVEAFLATGASDHVGYAPMGGPERDQGIPQGTSISLFLANVAAWDMDRALEGVGVGFTRYADDTLIWSTDYSRICEAVERLHEHAESIGVAVNREKSPGIRVLTSDDSHAEMESTHAIEYLGYELRLDRASIKPSAVAKIQERIGNLIYWTLLHEPINGTQDPSRLSPTVDRDYVSLVWRIRRYLYGDLSEKAVRRYQRRDAPLRRFRGVMSAYPLIDDTADLQELEEWLASQLWLAVRRRGELLTKAGIGPLPPPHGASRHDLLRLGTTSISTGQKIDLRVPSVRRIARVVTQAAALHGPSVVGKASPYDY